MEHLREEFHQAIADEMYITESKSVSIASVAFSPEEILKQLYSEKYEESFSEWLKDRKQNITERANEILNSHTAQDRFAFLKDIYGRGAVIPFIGAGMSCPSKYPGWSKFLATQWEEAKITEQTLSDYLSKGQFEEAAERLQSELSPQELNERLQNTYGIKRDMRGSVQMLPYCFKNSVITTNFDDTIERCYDYCGRKFDLTISGKEASRLRKLINEEGKRVLVKLHGNHGGNNRILTKSEYDAAYSENCYMDATYDNISQDSLLFLGCSLTYDRTIESLTRLMTAHGHDNRARHYAFMKSPEECQKRERERFLSNANIFPIWYSTDSFDHDAAIEALLYKLCEESV